MSEPERLQFKDLLIPIILLVVFWTLAVTLWLVKDRIFFLFNFGFIGTSVFIGLGLYEVLPRKKKPIGRKVAQALVGLHQGLSHGHRHPRLRQGRQAGALQGTYPAPGESQDLISDSFP